MKDLRARAQRAIGLASPALIAPAKPGAVYTIKDEAIAFPESRLPDAGNRNLHVTRYAIVLQAMVHCKAAKPTTIIVVPCSSSWPAGPCDLQLPEGEPAFPEKTVAFASLLQPILKSELVEHKGDLRVETLHALQTCALRNLGLIGQGAVPIQNASGQAKEPAPGHSAAAPVAPTAETSE